MIARRTYYSIKPFIPWRLRVALRRWRAARRRRSYADVWPINFQAGVAPEGWPGWPGGKRFAFVLTHDVESLQGVDNCMPLLALEQQRGFRSSFNFVPEAYTTPRLLRELLAAQGFEVGVHDLKHDGKLYLSREKFRQNAIRINQYLKDWGAVGFRSGFMLHEMDWLQELEVAYDSSTFDTDPFEPQPDGTNTIFPFWVPGPGDKGYVEMPYTLVQDFNLFIVLREPTNALWKEKLDWIASRGGMALMDVHPDYMAFPSATPKRNQYPAALYEEFLDYVNQKYAGQFWHALPREVAGFCARVKPPYRRPKRICMLSSSMYEFDNRVMRYAQSLVRRGDSVDVIAVAQNDQSPRTETIEGVRVVRLQTKNLSSHKLSHLWTSTRFLVVSSLLLALKHWRRPYDLVHVHNMPDFLVFSAWFPKLTGTGLILDIHDIFPEYYASKFKVRKHSLVLSLLKQIEHLCAAFADHVIISNHLWQEIITARSARSEKCSVFINSVDPVLFRPMMHERRNGQFVIVYPGSFNWHQGLDIAVRALARIKDELPEAELHLYGQGPAKEALVRLAKELKISARVRFFDLVPIQQIPELLAQAHAGVVPKRASDFFGNEAFSTKIMEFMSQGLPTVVARTRIDSYYFDAEHVRFFESENVEDLAQAFLELARDPALRERLARNGLEFVARNSWENQRLEYLRLVDKLAEN